MIEQLETEPEVQQLVKEVPRKSRGGLLRWLGAAALLALLVGIGIFPRLARERAVLAAVNESSFAHPVVSVIHPQKGKPTSELLLPGNIQPLYSSSIYARVDGYVDRRNVDIGSKVRTGELLAVISSPELDQQLQQARATMAQSQAALQQAKAALEQAKANAELARLTKERDIPLGEQDAVSKQTVDEAVQANTARLADVSAAVANVTAAEASIAANNANIARLQRIQAFESVVAPFDGIVTERNVERGDLVNAGSAGAKPMFVIAQSGVLRVQVDVPQAEAVNIRNGQKAMLEVQERLGREYVGTVIRSATSLNAAARTMLTEVQLDNRDGSLLPGMYAQVRFTMSQPHASMTIPTSSLVIDQSGMHVVAVNRDQRLHFVPVTIGRDFGTEIEILKGLGGAENLVANPSDLLSDGQSVEVH